jgi:hypothetical protein
MRWRVGRGPAQGLLFPLSIPNRPQILYVRLAVDNANASSGKIPAAARANGVTPGTEVAKAIPPIGCRHDRSARRVRELQSGRVADKRQRNHCATNPFARAGVDYLAEDEAACRRREGRGLSEPVRVLSVLSTIALKIEVHRRMMQPFLARVSTQVSSEPANISSDSSSVGGLTM